MSALQINAPRNETDNQAAGAAPYDLIGGEEKMFALVDQFYDLMESLYGTPDWMRNEEE